MRILGVCARAPLIGCRSASLALMVAIFWIIMGWRPMRERPPPSWSEKLHALTTYLPYEARSPLSRAAVRAACGSGSAAAARLKQRLHRLGCCLMRVLCSRRSPELLESHLGVDAAMHDEHGPVDNRADGQLGEGHVERLVPAAEGGSVRGSGCGRVISRRSDISQCSWTAEAAVRGCTARTSRGRTSGRTPAGIRTSRGQSAPRGCRG